MHTSSAHHWVLLAGGGHLSVCLCWEVVFKGYGWPDHGVRKAAVLRMLSADILVLPGWDRQQIWPFPPTDGGCAGKGRQQQAGVAFLCRGIGSSCWELHGWTWICWHCPSQLVSMLFGGSIWEILTAGSLGEWRSQQCPGGAWPQLCVCVIVWRML